MSKRRIERAIEEVSDDVLGDLTPGERLELVLYAHAQGRDEWIDRLVATCPQHSYQVTDHRFVERARLARLAACQAVYNLHTTLLQYTIKKLSALRQETQALSTDTPLAVDDGQAAPEWAGVRRSFAELYALYHAYQRFADATFGVALDTWLAVHPDGPWVVDTVAETLDAAVEVELTEEWLAGDGSEVRENTGADDEGGLDNQVDKRHEELQEVWTESVSIVEE